MNKELDKILIIEDDPDIRKIIQLILESIGGYTVAPCEHGVDALAILHEFNPDLVVYDVMMPVMDGPSTFVEIRKLPHLAHIPVVFMTARTQACEVEEYRRLGAVDVIAKPFDPTGLPAMLDDIWSRL